MKAVQFDRFGPPDVLHTVEMAKPEPEAGEVRVRVAAAGVNFFEVLMRADRYAVTPALPMHPGVEIAGVIDAIGADVDPGRLGARVAVPLFAFGRAGGYAEFVTVDAEGAIDLPDGIAFDAATAMLVQGLTALHLTQCSVLEGRNVLVHAAAGGVGSLLVQLAKAAGARSIIAVAGSAEKRELALSLGADRAIDSTSPAWPEQATEGGAVDIVFDTVGGEVGRASLDVLAPGGELVFAALGRFALTPQDLERSINNNQGLKGFSLLPLLSKEGVRRDLGRLFDLVGSGGLRLPPIHRFTFDDAASAHRAVEERRIAGKVALVP